MQKIRNRSNFFKKIFTSGILPKNLKAFRLYQVYFQKIWKRSRFSELFSKNLSMASSGRPDIGISAIPYAPIRQIRQNSPLPGLYPKSPSTEPFLSNFFQKFLSLHYCYRKNTLKRSHPFETFFKKSVTLYRGYIQNDTPLCCCFRKKFRKTSSPHHWLSVFHPKNVAQCSKKIENFYFLT